MSYEEIKDIFLDVKRAEEDVLAIYSQVTMKTNNNKIKETLAGIMKDEARHFSNAQEIIRILEEH